MTPTSAIRDAVAVPRRARPGGWAGRPVPTVRSGRPEPLTPAADPPRTRARGGAGEIAVASLLLAVWILLWTFFLDAVAVPAAHLEAAVARHPSVYPAAVAGPGGARPVDTAAAGP